jgi:hypothetical protein
MNWSVLVNVHACELFRFSPYSITFQASFAIPTEAEKLEYAAFSNRSLEVPMPLEPA